MFIAWLRESTSAAILILIFRLYVGYQWLTSGWGKLTGDEAFSALGFLKFATSEQMAGGDHPKVQGWWVTFLENVAIPNVGIFSFLEPASHSARPPNRAKGANVSGRLQNGKKKPLKSVMSAANQAARRRSTASRATSYATRGSTAERRAKGT